MLVTQFDNFVNHSTQQILGSQIERENLVPMLSTDIVRATGGVTGVKGENEVYYRTGNVNLTSADIGALDENNVYNGLDQTETGYALDARQGKTLDDKINTTQSDLALLNNKVQIIDDKINTTQSDLALLNNKVQIIDDKINTTQSDLALLNNKVQIIITNSLSDYLCGNTPQTSGMYRLYDIPTGYIPISVSFLTTNNDDYGAVLIGSPIYRTHDNSWSIRLLATAANSVNLTGTMYISCVKTL